MSKQEQYLGKLEQSSDDDLYRFNNDIMREAQKNPSAIPIYLIFWKKYKVYPCTLDVPYDCSPIVPYELTMKMLKEKYNHDPANDIVNYLHHTSIGHVYVGSRLIELTDGVLLHMHGAQLQCGLQPHANVEPAIEGQEYIHIFNGYKLYFVPGKDEFVKEFVKNFVMLKTKEYVPEASLQMICKNQYGFYLTAIKIKKPTISDLKLHYGPEFEKIHSMIVTALKADEAHGLILLHGLPGSGKTHYIRYLIQEITEKQLIYVPPDMTASISSPDFLPFMLQNTNSILIIEDAENIIKSRDSKESTTQAVANLLNLSDGLLGDSLHQPIIATFNCELNTIDPALLRKGRLITQFEFGKLDVESAQKLSDELGFKNKISEPMTLADIYGQEKEEKEKEN